MKQNYSKYTAEDQMVWNTLFKRQKSNLQTKSCAKYLDCLDALDFVLNESSIPDFKKLSQALQNTTGWEIEVVKGLIPVRDFFLLLGNKKFCSSTWLRKPEQLDYLEEPDMFHDIFGHIPLLADHGFAEFISRFAALGNKHIENPEVLVQLQRFYWYTIEFGLIRENGENRIYGAGIISSFGEANSIFEKPVNIQEFDLSRILNESFETDHLQSLYFSLDSWDQLYLAIEEMEKSFLQVFAS